MATIDVRFDVGQQTIDKIAFAAPSYVDSSAIADFVTNVATSGAHKEYVYIESTNNGHYTVIRKEDIHYLIKALEKAVELGWDK